MSFIYPRTISITRCAPNNSIGAVGYQGLNPNTETLIASNIPASIQEANTNAKLESLPGDANHGSMWDIFFKAALGLVKDRDIITDDLGLRYQITICYWNSLGYNCQCERLQT